MSRGSWVDVGMRTVGSYIILALPLRAAKALTSPEGVLMRQVGMDLQGLPATDLLLPKPPVC